MYIDESLNSFKIFYFPYMHYFSFNFSGLDASEKTEPLAIGKLVSRHSASTKKVLLALCRILPPGFPRKVMHCCRMIKFSPFSVVLLFYCVFIMQAKSSP